MRAGVRVCVYTQVTLFSAPNYCGEFDNAGAMMSVDDTLMCSFQVCCHVYYVYLFNHIII
jgi:hypothetical protein